ERGGLEGKEVRVFSFEPQEAGESIERLLVSLAIDQHARIVGRGCSIVRRESHRLLQQQLCFIERVALVRQASEQAQCFDVPPRAAQEIAKDALRERQLAVTEQASRVNDLCRQSQQPRTLLGRNRSVPGIAPCAVQALEHFPTRRQRGVDAHAALERFDRGGKVIQRDAAVAAFLISAAELRMLLGESIESRERRSVVPETALVHGSEI